MENINLSPILLFVYKRLDTLERTVAALKQNSIASDSELFIFSDGGKSNEDNKKVEEVRTFLRNISGFKKVILKESGKNMGLANSVIAGVTEVLKSYNSVIVLEDDLVTSPNFLNFMNESLSYYQDSLNVFSVSGYSFNLKIPDGYNYDVYFTKRSSSWGWAIWKDRWEKVDWSMKNFENTNWSFQRKSDFNKMGSDLYGMLKRQYQGKMDSWAIRFCFHQYLINSYTVFPAISKVQNIGYGDDATHTNGYNSFKTILDSTNRIEFRFTPPFLEDKIIRRFAAKRGYLERIKGKVLNFLIKRFMF